MNIVQKLALAIIASSTASGLVIGTWFTYAFEPTMHSVTVALPFIGVAIVYSIPIVTVVGIPGYFLLNQFNQAHWLPTSIIGVCSGALVGILWGHQTVGVFAAAGLAAGLVGGLLMRSNNSLQGTQNPRRVLRP